MKSVLSQPVDSRQDRLGPVSNSLPPLHLHRDITTPLKIHKIEMLRIGTSHYVRSLSRDGTVGIVIANDHLLNLLSLLKQVVIPYFIGKDARDLPTLLDGVYRHGSNYKYSGMPFWNCVGHIELSLFDMLGKAADKPVAELLGKVIRHQVPIYVTSFDRKRAAEAEVEWMAERLTVTSATACKFKIGGRMSNNADASPGRTHRLIALARKMFGEHVTRYADANGSV